jgi:preprotein translocase subunit YajC
VGATAPPAHSDAMADPRTLLLIGGSPPPGEGGSPFASLILMALIFGIFYFVLIMPMRTKQKKLEALVQALKSGDKVIINPGIFGTIVGVEDEAFLVRVDDKTRIKVLKSAVSGLQGAPLETEKK